MARLTPLSKGLITVIVIGCVGAALYKNRGSLPGGSGKPAADGTSTTSGTMSSTAAM